MDRWAWGQLEPWMQTRREFPIGAVLCVIHGQTAGRHWEALKHHRLVSSQSHRTGRAQPADPAADDHDPSHRSQHTSRSPRLTGE